MRVRRLWSVLLAAGFAGLAISAPPAAGAPAPPRLNTVFDPITIAPETPEDDYYTANLAGVLAERDQPGRARRVSYTIDLTEVADLVTLRFGGFATDVVAAADLDTSPCTQKGTVLDCVRERVVPTAGFIVQMGFFFVNPASTAETGDSGTITVTARVDDGPVTTSTATVRIGEGVDLAAGDDWAASVAPGGRTGIRPSVHNVGDKTVKGAVLALQVPRELVTTNASNCFYGYAVYCTFDTDLEPDHTYALSEPIVLRAPADAAAGSRAETDLAWLTPSLWEDLQVIVRGSLPGKRGTGEPISLVPQAASAGIPQIDVQGANDYAAVDLTVTGSDRPKLAATATAVRIRPGGTAQVHIGAVNRGPGTLYPDYFDNAVTNTELLLPSGVTAKTTDKRCFDSGQLWFCMAGATPLPAGDTLSFAFTLSADRTFSGGTALVSVRGVTTDEAELRIDAQAPGTGGGLPITGPATAPGLVLIAVGTMLVLAGRYFRTYAG